VKYQIIGDVHVKTCHRQSVNHTIKCYNNIYIQKGKDDRGKKCKDAFNGRRLIRICPRRPCFECKL